MIKTNNEPSELSLQYRALSFLDEAGMDPETWARLGRVAGYTNPHMIEHAKELGQLLSSILNKGTVEPLMVGDLRRSFGKRFFGPGEWFKYFENPVLPNFIRPLPDYLETRSIVGKPCPFDSKNQIQNTHALMMVPGSGLLGKNLRINTLIEYAESMKLDCRIERDKEVWCRDGIPGAFGWYLVTLNPIELMCVPTDYTIMRSCEEVMLRILLRKKGIERNQTVLTVSQTKKDDDVQYSPPVVMSAVTSRVEDGQFVINIQEAKDITSEHLLGLKYQPVPTPKLSKTSKPTIGRKDLQSVLARFMSSFSR